MNRIAADVKMASMVRFLQNAPMGCIVEVGTYEGGSLVYLAEKFPSRQFYGYDTFTGIPTTCNLDNYHKAGDFRTSFQFVQNNLARFSNIKLIEGVYPTSDSIKPSPIALAHVDVDVYQSTYDSFNHLAPLMAKGGRIYCDDAFVGTCEGATLAVCRYCYENLKAVRVNPLQSVVEAYIQF